MEVCSTENKVSHLKHIYIVTTLLFVCFCRIICNFLKPRASCINNSKQVYERVYTFVYFYLLIDDEINVHCFTMCDVLVIEVVKSKRSHRPFRNFLVWFGLYWKLDVYHKRHEQITSKSNTIFSHSCSRYCIIKKVLPQINT